MNIRQHSEQLEDHNLAPYAIRAKDAQEREFHEEPHEARTTFQRDRDRITYSTAFRRLEYKTQVFPNHEGDHYRTRLTHTIEVANLSRTIARCLRINEDFAECLALVHDLGHPPFGHCGEEILASLMEPYGGFEHNEQTLRVVTRLEKVKDEYPGLNLSKEVHDAIIQHTDNYLENNPHAGSALLETVLVSLTDEMAYDAHDLDDGFVSGILDEQDFSDLEIAGGIVDQADYPQGQDHRLRGRYIVRKVLNAMVMDFITTSLKKIEDSGISNIHEARACSSELLCFSEGMERKKTELESFLRSKMYQHPTVVKMMHKSHYFMERLFSHFRKFPQELPLNFQHRFSTDGVERSIADYIAGMTDRFIQEEYINLFMPFQKML